MKLRHSAICFLRTLIGLKTPRKETDTDAIKYKEVEDACNRETYTSVAVADHT